MRRVLEKRHRVTVTTDERVVELYQDREGFYQIVIERQVPFRNEIADLIKTSLVLDLLSGNKEISLMNQAENIVWVMRELGKNFKIDALEHADMPEYGDLGTEMEIKEAEDISPDIAELDFRPLALTRNNITTVESAKYIRKHYNLGENEPLLQLDGIKYIRRILDQFDEESLIRYQNALEEEQNKLINNLIRAVSSGISLSQSISAKDSSLGEVSDIAVVGNVYDGDEVDFFEQMLYSIRSAEKYCIDSCIAMDTLVGVDTGSAFTRLILEAKYTQMLMSAATEISIQVPDVFTDKNYGEKYKKAFNIAVNQYIEQYAKIGAETEKDSLDFYRRMSRLNLEYPIIIRAAAKQKMSPTDNEAI